MKQSIIILLLLAFSSSGLLATECSLKGSLFFGMDEEPLGNYEVSLAFFQENLFLESTTDEFGAFDFLFDLEFDGVGPIFGNVIVEDFCTGVVVIETAIFLAAYPDVEDFTIVICGEADPPPVPQNCEAFFYHQQATVAPYIMAFYDISSTAAPVDSWFWDFGDGATSTLKNPSHLYDATGEYEVSLTIQSDTCQSTYTRLVEVLDTIPCDCAGTLFPVCVTLPNEEQLIFLNECFAQCEGYSPDEYEPCINACQAEFNAVQVNASGLVQFTDQSILAGVETVSWLWDFGDGDSSILQNPIHTYSNSGAYPVSLRIITNGGCASTLIQDVMVSVLSSVGEETADGLEQVKVYPNPAGSRLTVELGIVRSGLHVLELYTPGGQLAREYRFDLASGRQNIQLKLEGLPAGMFFLRVQGAQNVKTIPIFRL